MILFRVVATRTGKIISRHHLEAVARNKRQALALEHPEWAEKEFGKSQTTIRTWVAWGTTTYRKSFKNIEQFTYTPKEEGGWRNAGPDPARKRP